MWIYSYEYTLIFTIHILVVDCGDLDPPANGDVEFSETTFESEANYSCDLNYRLEGPDRRECMENGEWSNGEPICERK